MNLKEKCDNVINKWTFMLNFIYSVLDLLEISEFLILMKHLTNEYKTRRTPARIVTKTSNIKYLYKGMSEPGYRK